VRILVVDDEPQIIRVLRTALQSSGHEVDVAHNGEEGLAQFLKTQPELVITDLAMPGMDGTELTKEIRERAQTPIIVLSVRNQDAAKVAALDEGADDYITKPFSIQELLARVRVQQRRAAAAPAEETVVEVGDFRIDIERHRVTVRGDEVRLTPKEFDLMVYFARNADRVLTHKTLLRAVWGLAGIDQPEYLRVLVAQLRKKIEGGASEPKYILSEPWVGYRFSPRAAEEDGAEAREVPITSS
jgi:two-component system KDP operon response regulator KdpE